MSSEFLRRIKQATEPKTELDQETDVIGAVFGLDSGDKDKLRLLIARDNLMLGAWGYRDEYGDPDPEWQAKGSDYAGKQMEHIMSLVREGKSRVVEAFNRYTEIHQSE